MSPKIQKKITFINTCGCLCDHEILEKAIISNSSRNTVGVRKIFLHGVYPAVTINGDKKHIHRLVFSYDKGVSLKQSDHIHHKDHDKLNANLDNLEVINSSEHIKKHLSGKKQEEIFAMIRTNKSCVTRYGHNTKKYDEYLKTIHEAKQ